MLASPRSSRLGALALVWAVVLSACSDRAQPDATPTSPEIQASVLQGSVEFEQEMGAVRAAQARFTEELMARPGVVGTAVGLGEPGRLALLVLVEDASVSVPGRLGGVGVRPLVTGTIYALQEAQHHRPGHGGGPGGGGGGDEAASLDRTDRWPRPVPIGVSTGHTSITAGTIGARVTDGANVYVLSNNHVYAATNAASIGDAVLQPGTYDGGSSPDDDIGTLAAFKEIVFGGLNDFDAAIASTTTDDVGNATASDGYGMPKTATAQAELNMQVQKCGRTTNCTNGSVAGINAVVNVNYGAEGIATFVDQIVISPGSFSAGGDSGSLVVVRGKGRSKASDRKPVGLLFAGSSFYTIASPIDPILDHFGVTIDGEE